MSYKEFSSLPEYEPTTYTGSQPVPSVTLHPRWSGSSPPPSIGAFVLVTMNGIGPAEVTGYFVQSDWLGLIVKPVTPPEWFIKQNGYNATGHVFGAEIASGTITPPAIDGPSQEQLAALQSFATSRGRSWKKELNAAWMNGADAREPNGHLLRQIRNEYGSSWLIGRKNPIKPASTRSL